MPKELLDDFQEAASAEMAAEESSLEAAEEELSGEELFTEGDELEAEEPESEDVKDQNASGLFDCRALAYQYGYNELIVKLEANLAARVKYLMDFYKYETDLF